jgi:tetratricopeptide (TPR) repeat protein
MKRHILSFLAVSMLLAADDPKSHAEKEALAHNWGAVGYIIKGDYDKAIAECTEAIRLDPKNDLPHLNRGSAYVLKGEHDKAIADFNQAIRLDPKNDAPYSNRAAAHAAKGSYSEAIKGYQEAMQVNPKKADTYAYLADLLATCPMEELRDGKTAVELATKACEMSKWNDSISLSALAAAYAEVRDFKKAVELQKKAVKASGFLVLKRKQELEEDRQRLKQYEEGKPYRRRAGDALKPDTDKTDQDALQGTWVAEAGENSKEKFDKELKSIRLVFKGDKLTLKFGDDVQQATFKLNPTPKPKTIDISFTG